MPISSKYLASALIESVEENPSKSKKLVGNFVKFCRERGMAHKLPKVLRCIELKNEEEKERKKIKITSVEKFDEKLVKEIIKKTVGLSSNTEIETRINKHLIGGFIVEHEGVVYDASLRGQLKKIKNKLIA